jgi:hypothetical protein
MDRIDKNSNTFTECVELPKKTPTTFVAVRGLAGSWREGQDQRRMADTAAHLVDRRSEVDRPLVGEVCIAARRVEYHRRHLNAADGQNQQANPFHRVPRGLTVAFLDTRFHTWVARKWVWQLEGCKQGEHICSYEETNQRRRQR